MADGNEVIFATPKLTEPELRAKLSGIVAASRTRGVSHGNSEAQHVPDDPVTRLRDLAQLRDDGIISTEEFEEKKRDLLDRM
ncbi:MAG: SHOCT domain-containing protein [Chloroflexi bacterium]|nr:SHOCT domain-containing protein [Chloroflexota bacterium]